MLIKLTAAFGFATLIIGAAFVHASNNTQMLSATPIIVKSINDNMLGYRPIVDNPISVTAPLSSTGKSVLELASPVSVMVTDIDLNHYFLSGTASLGFKNGYFAIKMVNGRRFLCPADYFSTDCETVTSFNQHGKSKFSF